MAKWLCFGGFLSTSQTVTLFSRVSPVRMRIRSTPMDRSDSATPFDSARIGSVTVTRAHTSSPCPQAKTASPAWLRR